MIVNIKSISIEGFMSIGKAEIDFTDRGTVLVKGINQYEELAGSNGSGKSAIFESILWVLTGKTSRGSSNVVNRYTSTGATVKIHMFLDDLEYVITRTEGGSDGKYVKIVRDGEDISGNTLTKSRQVLEQELGFIDYEVLTSIIILSQGLPGRLSTLRPAARKARLEFLSNTDGFLEELTSVINHIHQSITDKLSLLDRKEVELQAKISTHQNIIKTQESAIDRIKSRQSDTISHEEYVRVMKEIEELTKEKDSVQNVLQNVQKFISQYESDLREVNNKEITYKQKINTNQSEINHIVASISQTDNPECPTCRQLLQSEESKGQVMSKLRDLKDITLKLNEELEKLSEPKRLYTNKIDQLKQKKRKLDTELSEYLEDISVKTMYSNKYQPNQEDTSTYEESIQVSKKEVEVLEEELKEVQKSRSEVEKELTIANFYKNSASRQLRNFLLENVINYLNSRLEVYSEYLFQSQGVVKVVSEGNRVDIMLGDSYFEDLSGGEGRRVDLLLQLAQRDLSTSESGFRCNILVLDEILDYLDSTGVVNTLNLLDSKSSSVECMMIVTHREEVPVPYDSVLTAVKGSDRVTQVVEGLYQ